MTSSLILYAALAGNMVMPLLFPTPACTHLRRTADYTPIWLSADRHMLHRRQGPAAQAQSADADDAPEAERHVEKAARTEEPAARSTPQGQALLQACARVLRGLQPSAESVRDSCMLTLSLR